MCNASQVKIAAIMNSVGSFVLRSLLENAMLLEHKFQRKRGKKSFDFLICFSFDPSMKAPFGTRGFTLFLKEFNMKHLNSYSGMPFQ